MTSWTLAVNSSCKITTVYVSRQILVNGDPACHQHLRRCRYLSRLVDCPRKGGPRLPVSLDGMNCYPACRYDHLQTAITSATESPASAQAAAPAYSPSNAEAAAGAYPNAEDTPDPSPTRTAKVSADLRSLI